MGFVEVALATMWTGEPTELPALGEEMVMVAEASEASANVRIATRSAVFKTVPPVGDARTL
jgi:hypothetical protein